MGAPATLSMESSADTGPPGPDQLRVGGHNISFDAAYPLLEERILDPSYDLKYWAVQKLGYFGSTLSGKPAVAKLVALYHQTPDPPDSQKLTSLQAKDFGLKMETLDALTLSDDPAGLAVLHNAASSANRDLRAEGQTLLALAPQVTPMPRYAVGAPKWKLFERTVNYEHPRSILYQNFYFRQVDVVAHVTADLDSTTPSQVMRGIEDITSYPKLLAGTPLGNRLLRLYSLAPSLGIKDQDLETARMEIVAILVNSGDPAGQTALTMAESDPDAAIREVAKMYRLHQNPA